MLVAEEPLLSSRAAGESWIVGTRTGRVVGVHKEGLVDVEPLTGLPLASGRIVAVQGRLPGSVWVTLSVPDEHDEKRDRTPIYRRFGKDWREIAPNWQPLLASWSKHRVLAGSTSSGRLKLKVVEPHVDEPPADIPSPRVGDARCQKTFTLRDLAALLDGTVFGVGRCTVGSDKRASYVAVRWLDGSSPTPAGSTMAGAPDPSAAPTAMPSSSTEPAGGAGGSTPNASAAPPIAASAVADGPSDEEPRGAPAIVDVVSSSASAHRSLLLVGPEEAYLAAAEDDRGGKAHVWRFDGGAWRELDLPPLAGPLVGLARASDGTLWLAAKAELYRRPADSAQWVAVALPSTVLADDVSAWDLDGLEAGADAVWLVGSAALASGATRHVLLAPRDAVSAREPRRWGR